MAKAKSETRTRASERPKRPKPPGSGRKERYTPAQVAEAIRAAGGLYAVAARRLGCSWNTVRDYVAKYPEVKAAADEANETNLDVAEAKLLEQVRAGAERPLLFYLRTKGRARGYGDRQEITGPDGGPIAGVLFTAPGGAPPDAP